MHQDKTYTFNERAFRDHQYGAYRVICDRVEAGEDTVSIVLPPRFGKSDVMRMSALRLIADGVVSRAFLITPSSVLARQLLDEGKMAEMRSRYSLVANRIPYIFYDQPPEMPFPNVDLTALTIQRAVLNTEFFAEVVKDEIWTKRLRPIVYFDEVHTTSRDNAWGRCIQSWLDAGAHVVGLTGTPYRTDRGQIPGFTYHAIEGKTVTVRRRVGEALIEIGDGFQTTYKAEADYLVELSEVWDESDEWDPANPPVLATIGHRPFAVTLNRLDGLTDELKSRGVLSDLNGIEVRGPLREAVKNEGVVHDACAILNDVLMARQSTVRDTAAIVYVGNDDEELDAETNGHAKLVERTLKSLNRDLEVLRATAKDERPDSIIRDFQRGRGDVLIVKQMGGVGLDVPRLKVCLDLSVIRTRTSFIQRITRVATLWDLRGEGRPEDMIRAGEYISPDDCLVMNLFENLVRKQGGAATITDIENWRTEGYQPVALPPRDHFEITGTDVPEQFSDTRKVVQPGERLSMTERLTGLFPGLLNWDAKATISKKAHESGLRFADEDDEQDPVEPTSEPIKDPESPKTFHDTGEELKGRREHANQLAKRIVRLRLGPQVKPNSAEWQQGIVDVWVNHKDSIGIRKDYPLRKLVMDDRLYERLIASFEQEIARRNEDGLRGGRMW